ncbi:MAG: alpha/beta family hydrolase, partial [Nocardioides sp.]
VVGGRSAGARSAARSALALEARGAVALAFPLHPPGRPERSRADELRACGVPLLVVQGERDSMGRPEEFPEPPSTGLDLAVVPHADHSLRVPARAPISHGQALGLVVDAVANWLAKLA